MTTISLPVTSRGTSDANNFSDVKNNDQAIIDVVNGNLTNGNLSGSAAITDANLASPNNSAYKLLAQAGGVAASGSSGDYYFIGSSGNAAASAGATSVPPSMIIINSLYQVVAGKTQKLRTLAVCATHNSAPAITITVGLYPVSSISAAAYTLGTVVSGSTVAFASPSANTVTSSASAADISLPSNGVYVLGVNLSGSQTDATKPPQLAVQLLTRNV